MTLKTDRKLSKTFGIIALVTILIGTSFTSTQTAYADLGLINFDAKSDGDIITDDFKANGAIFSSAVDGAKILEDTPEAKSLDNILVGTGGVGGNEDPIWIDIVDAAGNPAVTDGVSLWVISVGGATITVTAENALGIVVDTKTVGPTGSFPADCVGLGNQDLIVITGVGAIATVHIEKTALDGNCSNDGFGIDNVLIEDLLEGCSSGFWKNDARKHGAGNWNGLSPNSDLEDELDEEIDEIIRVKGPNSGSGDEPTLLGALNAKGGGWNALVREAAAALLNIADSTMNYPLTLTELKDLFDGDFTQSDPDEVEALRALLFGFNHAGCTLTH